MVFALRLLLLYLLPLLAFCAEDYYKLLGVSKSANDKDLKKAYRNLSKKYHPDKNPGDDEAAKRFVDVSDAYNTLTDPELKKIYDTHGHEGLEQHKNSRGRGGPAADPFDLFSRFFGGQGHFGGERKGPNQEVRIAVPLREFYRGGEVDFTVDKQAICETCEGSGSQDGKMQSCGDCNGRGVVLQKIMLAPGIFQQAQSQCGACGGQGKVVKHKCKTCGGQRVVRKQEEFKVTVERGMPRGGRAVFENEADASPDWVAGNLYVQLMEQEPVNVWADGAREDGTFFRRKDDNLFWREILSLREAWMGDWSRNVTHLDGRSVRIGRKRGEVVQPGMVEIIKGEGMPIWEGNKDEEDRHDELQFGNLHIEYVVVLPDQMDKGLEKEFWGVWEKFRAKKGVDLHKDSGRPEPKEQSRHDEL